MMKHRFLLLSRARLGFAVLLMVMTAILSVPHAASANAALEKIDFANEMAKNPSLLVPPSGSPPNGSPQTVGKNGARIKCDDIPEAKGGILIGKIVPCIARTIETGTQSFSQKMVNLLRPLLYTFLTLVVVLFGVRVATGEPEVYKQGFLLLVKVTLVLAILDQIPSYFVPKAYEIMKQSQVIALDALNTSDLKCKMPAPVTLGGEKPLKIWVAMDCLMGKLFGYSTGVIGEGPNMLLVTSIFGLLTGFLFGGPWAMIVFFAMLGVLVSMFTLVARTVLAFISGYLIICLMLIISPLLMPLVFMRSTSGYFDGVWKNILAGFLMPIVVGAYAMIALMLYDKMLFADDSIVQKLFTYSNVSPALKDPKQACDWMVTGNQSNRRDDPSKEDANDASGTLKRIFANPFTSTTISNLQGSNSVCGPLRKPVFDLTRVRGINFKGSETYQKIFESLAALFILAWLIQNGMERVMSVMRNLVGAGTTVTSLQAGTEFEKQISGSMNRARDTAIESMKGVKGDEFRLSQAPKAFEEGAKAFLGGVKR